MRSAFDKQLDDLFVDISRLAIAANESLFKAIEAYNKDDKELAHELFSDDLRINASTIEIEQKAYRIIALQQPVARDLRKVFTVLQASSDIERFADHAVSVGRVVIRRPDDYVSNDTIDHYLNEMAKTVEEMLGKSIDALISRDPDLARDTAAQDSKVDACLQQVIQEASRSMEENHSTIATGIGHIQMASSLERMGDYVTNICERVVYLQTGAILELN